VRAQQAQANIPVVTHDDLRWADGIAWGTPTRYGNMSAQMKQFVDTTGGLWLKGELEDKATGIFTSTATLRPAANSSELEILRRGSRNSKAAKRPGPIMELLLILIYVSICYVVFKVFRIPVNQWSLATAAVGGMIASPCCC
jgi:multimeric flavodoxin WrbA